MRSRVFYVQDERYSAVPWMAKSAYVQDGRYDAVPWMAKSGDVQDERWHGQFFAPAKTAFPPSVAVMAKSAYVQMLYGLAVKLSTLTQVITHIIKRTL